jgi:hypothetical protein
MPTGVANRNGEYPSSLGRVVSGTGNHGDGQPRGRATTGTGNHGGGNHGGATTGGCPYSCRNGGVAAKVLYPSLTE